MPGWSSSDRPARVGWVIAIVVVMLGLWWAREVVVPLVFAALGVSVLLPLARGLERQGLGLAACALLVSIAWLCVVQVVEIAATLPAYEANLRGKIAASPLGRVIESAEGLSETPGDLSRRADKPGAAPQGGDDSDALPVRIVGASGGLAMLGELLRHVLRPLVLAGFALVVAVFIMLRWEDVRERTIRLVSRGRITLTTKALDDLSASISRVMRLQLFINVGAGLAVGLALWAIGVPNAMLWGTLAGALRYVPYVGPVIAAGAPAVLALAVSDGWALPLTIVGVCLLIELIVGNVVEPVVLGARTGVSTVALLVAAAFWTWLWGLPGLLLSTPITVGLAVIARHVPALAFLDILLGDAPALAPATRFYQRVAALDRVEAARLASECREQHGIEAMFEQLVMPALAECEVERADGGLDPARADAMLGILEDVVAAAAAAAGDDAGAGRAGEGDAAPIILCLPARTQADEVAAEMVATVLRARGRRARGVSLLELGGGIAEIVGSPGGAERPVVCITAAPP
jgi:predicted PurR-regulated permease PerM